MISVKQQNFVACQNYDLALHIMKWLGEVTASVHRPARWDEAEPA